MNGYKQFKNRGIRLNKLLQKKLGNRYSSRIESEGTTHTLIVTYNGAPWDTEQLIALPVIDAAQSSQVDPALLMSLIRHVSNFDFDYRGQKDSLDQFSLNRRSMPSGVRFAILRLPRRAPAFKPEPGRECFFRKGDPVCKLISTTTPGRSASGSPRRSRRTRRRTSASDRSFSSTTIRNTWLRCTAPARRIFSRTRSPS